MRSIYSASLKGNNHLAKGILTGILRVSRESIFSGFNNPSIYTVLQDQCSKQFGILEKEPVTLGTALIHGDLQLFHQALQDILLQTMSYHDFANNPENAFHAFMAGLLVWLGEIYEVKSNKESGLERYDLVLIPLKNNYPGYIFEFKSLNWYRPEAPPKEFIEKELQGVYQQIDDKMVASEFAVRNVATVNKVELLFHKKQVWMKEPGVS